MVRPACFGQDPVWPRPFSICQLTPEALTLFVQACGRGTDALCRLRPGDTATVWGPLGQGFDLEPETPTLMLAGGVGLAPFVEYAATHPIPANLALVFGHRQPLSCYPFAEMANVVGRAEAFEEKTPEDLPRFIELLETNVAEYAGGLIVACGPRLLMTVARLARRFGPGPRCPWKTAWPAAQAAAWAAWRKTPWASTQTCTQGPVFWVEELQLSEEA